MKKITVLTLMFTVGCIIAGMLLSCSKPVIEKTADGLIVSLDKKSENPGQSIRLRVISDKIIRVTAVPGKEFPECTEPDGNKTC